MEGLKKTTMLAASLALAAALGGCQPPSNNGESADESELVATNGLPMINGLTMTNGLSGNGLSGNGLSGNGLTGQALMMNPLSTGLTSSTYLMNSAAGRSTLSYMIRCALPANHSITKTDSLGASYTFAGGIGLAPQWETSTCDGDCQRWISACLLAHVNTAGIHVPIWIVGQNSGLGWGQSTSYPNQEGSFFGNIFTINNNGHTDAYYCEGPGFDKSVVDGRIGSNQVGAPYRDMASDGYCGHSICLQSDTKTNNVPDGYKACTMGDGSMQSWNQVVTVWRQNTAYDSSGNVIAGTTADGRTVKFDFEGDSNGWSSGTSLMTIASSIDWQQTGTHSLKVMYGSGSSTLRLQSANNVSIAAGSKVTLYVFLAANGHLSTVTPWLRNSAGATYTQAYPVTNLLQGSWNALDIYVPSGVTANQVGIDFTTAGAFTAYVDGVTW